MALNITHIKIKNKANNNVIVWLTIPIITDNNANKRHTILPT